MIKGMGGPDIEEFVGGLPKQLGEEVGRHIRAYSAGSPQQDSGQLAKWLDSHRDKAADLMGAILARLAIGGGQELESDSLIPYYLDVLNSIVGAMRTTRRDMVLRGFLHTDACLSYWRTESRDRPVDLLKKHPSLDIIMMNMGCPQIYLLDGPTSRERLRDLNLVIRKHGGLEFNDYYRCPRVGNIREFEIELNAKTEKLDLPVRAPGIPELLWSVPIAMQAQAIPLQMLKDTIERARQTPPAGEGQPPIDNP
jgi:hypothetical protein